MTSTSLAVLLAAPNPSNSHGGSPNLAFWLIGGAILLVVIIVVTINVRRRSR